jgi:hypothetical protein
MNRNDPADLDMGSQSRAIPWKGLTAFVLLAFVGAFGSDITASPYYPNPDHYIPRYVLLAFSVGLGISAVRSSRRMDRLIGVAVLGVGISLVAYIILSHF